MSRQRENGRSVEYLALLPEPPSQSTHGASWGGLYFVGVAVFLLVFAWTGLPAANGNGSRGPNGQAVQPLGSTQALQAATGFADTSGNGALRLNRLQPTGSNWTAVYGITQGPHSNESLCVEFARRGNGVRPNGSYACH